MAYNSPMTNAYKFRTFTCEGCGQAVARRAPPGSSFCSLPCYRKSARPKRKTGELKNCGACAEPVYVPAAQLKDVNFCSVDCHNTYQSRNKSNYVCAICEAPFALSPSLAKARKPKYCSIACRNKCPAWKKNAVIAGNLIQQNSKKRTSLEVLGEDLLDAMGLAYQTQVLIAEKFTVDALIGEKLVIQWDGDYWHGFRREGDATPLSARQAKRAALDKSQDAYMRKCGYTVLRFWEHEVKQNSENVRENIARAIQQSAA